MKNIKPVLMAVFIYVFIQGTALWISSGGYGIERGVVEKVERGDIPPVTEDPDDPNSAVYLFTMVMVSTVFLLILLKYARVLIKVGIVAGFMMGLYLTFSSMAGEVVGCIMALFLLALFILKRQNILVINMTLLFVIPGIGSLLGASLSLIPALVFIVAMSFYDIIAVFGTKHMVKIAEEARDDIPLMFSIPAGDRYLGLGTGDLALPVVFTVAMLRDYPIQYPVISAIGGAVGIAALTAYILNRKGLALPALPPITVGLLLGFILASLIL